MLQAKQNFDLLGISDGSWKIMWLSISAECGTMSHKNTLRFVLVSKQKQTQRAYE